MDAIVLRDLHKEFRLRHDRSSSLKGMVLSFRKSRFETIDVLKGLNLTVKSGETVAVVGRNGSGKSTLLGIIARVYRPTSGAVTVNGRISSLLELGAGFHPDLTGVENIYLNASILGISRREVDKRLDHIVSFAELEKFIDSPIRTYSNGMVLRLGFSVAVQADPDILLVDEVLAVGDERFQQKCYDKVQEFQDEGKTILFVSHDLAAVRKVANRVIWLEAGEIRADGHAEEVLAEYMAKSAAGCGV